jgi:glutathione S-transferase
MILIGHFDSPYVRRVAISLTLLGIDFERNPLSVFSDADALRAFNPLGRVPVLVIEGGEALVESGAILDYLDERVGLERALLPLSGQARRADVQLMVLATGMADKAVSIGYEQRRTPDKMDEGWMARCRGQVRSALAELERRYQSRRQADGRWLQPEITTAVMLGYVRMRQPALVPAGSYPALEALCVRAEASPAFRACRPSAAELGGSPEEVRAALARLTGEAPR